MRIYPWITRPPCARRFLVKKEVMATAKAQPPATAKGRRADKRGISTRAKLTSVALDIIAEGGEDTLSLADVAERAVVTRGTIYHHFKRRSELILAACEKLEAAMEALAFVNASDDDPYGKVAALAAEDPAVFRSHLRLMLRDGPTATPDLRANIAQFEKFMTEGRLQENVDPFIGAMLAVSGELAALLVMQTATSKEQADELIRRFSITFHRLLCHGILKADPPNEWPKPQPGSI